MLEARSEAYMLYEKILKIWCSLVRFGAYILIRLYLEKLIYFYIKIIVIATRLNYEYVSYSSRKFFENK